MGVAPMVAMEPFADGSISNLACNISICLCTNFGAFIKKCTIDPLWFKYIDFFSILVVAMKARQVKTTPRDPYLLAIGSTNNAL